MDNPENNLFEKTVLGSRLVSCLKLKIKVEFLKSISFT